MKKSLITAAVAVAVLAMAGCATPETEASESNVFDEVSVYVDDVADIVTGQ